MPFTNSRETDTLQIVGVIRHSMATYATDGDGILVTRSAGERAWSDVEKAMASQRGDYVVALDFEGVKAISVPFADTSVGRLMSGRASGYYDHYPMVLVNANEDVRETIDAALRVRRLHVLALSHGRPDLLGGDGILEETFEKAMELGEFTVNRLADELNLTPQAANNRLFALIRAGALARSRSHPERGGRSFLYSVPRMTAA
jgi:hypothetical protein